MNLLLLLASSLSLLVLVRLLLIISGLLSPGLLRDLALHQIDGVLFKFLPNLLLFTLPLVLKAV